LVEDLSNVKVEYVSLGSSHTLCLLRNGKVLCWGSSSQGKLGLEAALDRNFLTPKELITLDKVKANQLFASAFHSLILTEMGEIYTFGNNKDGKLGFSESEVLGGSTVVPIPRKISNCPLFFKKWSPQDDRN
jgi:alpha-tubulin suppressor-like RCC1 family protein